jgi:hypothetical protein
MYIVRTGKITRGYIPVFLNLDERFCQDVESGRWNRKNNEQIMAHLKVVSDLLKSHKGLLRDKRNRGIPPFLYDAETWSHTEI